MLSHMPLNGPSIPSFFFFFNDTATTEIYTLSLHDALPISVAAKPAPRDHDAERHAEEVSPDDPERQGPGLLARSEEHTSELQSPCNLVCRLLLEKKKKQHYCPHRSNAAPSGPRVISGASAC